MAAVAVLRNAFAGQNSLGRGGGGAYGTIGTRTLPTPTIKITSVLPRRWEGTNPHSRSDSPVQRRILLSQQRGRSPSPATRRTPVPLSRRNRSPSPVSRGRSVPPLSRNNLSVSPKPAPRSVGSPATATPPSPRLLSDITRRRFRSTSPRPAKDDSVEVTLAINRIKSLLSLRGDLPKVATQVTSYMYLGNMKNAMDVAEMKSLGITHVLNMAATDTAFFQQYAAVVPQNFVLKEIHADDTREYDITQHLEEAQEFILAAKEAGGKVLVHCYAGINRSGFVVASHLLLRGWPLTSIVSRLKQERGVFLSNPAFQDYAIQLALRYNAVL